jgi:hypothetical protein
MGNGEVPIEDFCKEVGFSAEVTAGGDVTIENTKNIPIFGIKVLKVGKGSKKELGSKDFGSTVDAVKAGQTYTFSSVFSGGAAAGEDVLVLPTLLGFAKEQRKTYTCDEDFGVPTKVIS